MTSLSVDLALQTRMGMLSQAGILRTDVMTSVPDSSGIIHAHGYMKSNDDAFVPAYLIRSARLRTGDVIEGSLRPSRGGVAA